MFFPPIPLIRRMHIMSRLKKSGAFSPATAKTLAQAGVMNPYSFNHVTRRLVNDGDIVQLNNGTFYLPL